MDVGDDERLFSLLSPCVLVGSGQSGASIACKASHNLLMSTMIW